MNSFDEGLSAICARCWVIGGLASWWFLNMDEDSGTMSFNAGRMIQQLSKIRGDTCHAGRIIPRRGEIAWGVARLMERRKFRRGWMQPIRANVQYIHIYRRGERTLFIPSQLTIFFILLWIFLFSFSLFSFFFLSFLLFFSLFFCLLYFVKGKCGAKAWICIEAISSLFLLLSADISSAD